RYILPTERRQSIREHRPIDAGVVAWLRSDTEDTEPVDWLADNGLRFARTGSYAATSCSRTDSRVVAWTKHSKSCMSSADAVSASGCHWTPMQNQSWSSDSIDSMTPSGDLAPTRRPLPSVLIAW